MRTKLEIRNQLIDWLDCFSEMEYADMRTTDIVLNHYKEKVREYDTVFMYGAGKYGKIAVEYLWDELKNKEVYFIDSNENKSGVDIELKNGKFIKCYTIDKMYGCDPDRTIIFITTIKSVNSVYEKLLGDLPYCVPSAYQSKDKLSYTYIDKAFVTWLAKKEEGYFYARNKEMVVKAFDLMEDSFSCKVYYEMIFSWCSGDDMVKSVTTKPQYFPPEIVERLTDNEVFLDCGAGIGDSIEDFVKYSNNKFCKIYSFEMDKDTYGELLKNELVRNDKRVVTINAGVSNEDREVRYRQAIYRSSYVDGMTEYATTAEEVALLRTADGLVDDGTIRETVTYIKMDIEGAEMDALEGMKGIIKRDRPKLAVCVYHKAGDIYELTNYIHSLVPEYKFILRTHHWCGCSYETVVYAFIG